MKRSVVPFPSPTYVTRPLMPVFEDFVARLESVWQSAWLTNYGRQHAELEQALTTMLDTPHLSLFNNGTTALMIAAKAAGLKKRVITTPFTFPGTVHALDWIGLEPVFCDIDEESLCIDPVGIERVLSSKAGVDVGGILGVHVYGNPCDVEAIDQIAHAHQIPVVYDAAHAFGTTYKGKSLGRYGDVTMYSFHATKLFSTIEGGGLSFENPDLKERVELLRNFGIRGPEEVVMSGINGKMNEIQAAFGLSVLKVLDAERVKRSEVRKTYIDALSDVPGLRLLSLRDGASDSLQYFPILINEREFGASRDDVHAQLAKQTVNLRKYFFPLCSEYSCYRHLPSANPDNLKVATGAAKKVLCLPFYGELAKGLAADIAQMILDVRPVALRFGRVGI